MGNDKRPHEERSSVIALSRLHAAAWVSLNIPRSPEERTNRLRALKHKLPSALCYTFRYLALRVLPPTLLFVN